MMMRLDPNPLPLGVGDERRHVLALSGGGFRGLFTARVLERIEAVGKTQIGAMFDLLTGTSVGGIIGLALSQGIPAASIRESLQKLGPAVFRPRRFTGRGWFSAQYSDKSLRRAIGEILGSASATLLCNVAFPLVVVAIDENSMRPRLLCSEGLAGNDADSITLMDAALATSAAPTFFPAHISGERSYIDGGLIANAPDLVAVAAAIRWLGANVSNLRLLSIGTAGIPSVGPNTSSGAAGIFSWLRGRKLLNLVATAQELLVHDQVNYLLPDRSLRLDASPPSRIPLDDTRTTVAQYLIRLADDAFFGRDAL